MTDLQSLLANLDTRWLAAGTAAAGIVVGSHPAEAAIVWSGPVSINIPSTTAGIYLNVVTGAHSSNPSQVSGWDINPWSSSALDYFTPTPNPGGGEMVGLDTSYFNLALGTLIGPTSTYTLPGVSTIHPGTPHNFFSSNNNHGFRFINETMGNCIEYGFVRVSLSETASSQPRSIVEYAYDNSCGTPIRVDDFGPEPTTLALLALGSTGLVIRRRKLGTRVPNPR